MYTESIPRTVHVVKRLFDHFWITSVTGSIWVCVVGLHFNCSNAYMLYLQPNAIKQNLVGLVGDFVCKIAP